MNRIIIVTGHYGSGKTEFSVSFAVYAACHSMFGYSNMAVVDLDIINPYFRSREREEFLGRYGIPVYGSFYGGSVTAEIPELSPSVRTPLENKDTFTIVDAGGNEAGARILRQFGKYFTNDSSSLWLIINAYRPETRDIGGALYHLNAIERETGRAVDGIVNNTHLLRETKAEDILCGHRLCQEICKRKNIPLIFDCFPSVLIDEDELSSIGGRLMPIGMYMRESWLDK